MSPTTGERFSFGDPAYRSKKQVMQGDSRSPPGRAVSRRFIPFQARAAELGIYNGLTQLVIQMTAPGLPDFSQGTELWDLTLVDPENRRPTAYRDVPTGSTIDAERGAAPCTTMAAATRFEQLPAALLVAR